MSKQTKLCQILAVEKGAKAKKEQVLTEAYHQAQKSELFKGLTRVYAPTEEGGDELPSEETKVQKTAAQLVKTATDVLTDLFDITYAKDRANAEAKADVIVDGNVLLPQVPVTYLLFLEKQLIDVRTFVSKIPTLDPSEEWTFEPNANCFVSKPSKTVRTKKVFVPILLAPATDKHPAQIKETTEDQKAGIWTTLKFSGAMPAATAADLLARVEKLQRAVKFAREECNLLPIEQAPIGAKVFHFLFGLADRGLRKLRLNLRFTP